MLYNDRRVMQTITHLGRGMQMGAPSKGKGDGLKSGSLGLERDAVRRGVTKHFIREILCQV